MNKLVPIFFFLCLYSANGQQYDYQWPFGYGNSFQYDFGISMLDFREEQISLYAFAEVPNFEMGNFSSFVCNREGELVLMTNNCRIVNRDFQTVPGSEHLTPGPTYDNYCEKGYYTADQTTLFVPELTNDSTYYLLHKDSEISGALQDVLSKNLYFSTVVQKADGSFYLKEKQLLLQTDMIWGRLTAGPNKDGDKWWGIVIGYNSNRFYKILVGGEAGVEGPFPQEIGIPVINQELDIGQIAFSPDGQHLAINSERRGVMLYDFDADNGLLSNFRSIAYPNMNSAEGLCFSPDSRFIYTTTAEDLYQTEWAEPDSATAIVHLGRVVGIDKTNWPFALGQMYLGPDCRVYISPGSTTYYLHVIHQPNEKGLACQLEEQALRAPTNIDFDLPNIPMYRFNGACDENINWLPTAVSEVEKDFAGVQLSPNPARDYFEVIFEQAPTDDWTLRLTDVLGRELIFFEGRARQELQEFSVADFTAGIYYYQIKVNGALLKSGELLILY